MTRTAAKNGFKVCLVSAHAFFLTQFHDLLDDTGFDPQVHRLDGSLLGGDLNSLTASRVSVYVIDAHTNAQITTGLVSHIIASYPKSSVVVLSEQLEEATAFPLLHCGIKGPLTYSEATEQLPRALEAVSSGSYWSKAARICCSRALTLTEIARNRLPPFRPSSRIELTKREIARHSDERGARRNRNEQNRKRYPRRVKEFQAKCIAH